MEYKFNLKLIFITALLYALSVLNSAAYGAIGLTPDLPSGQPVGTTITWTVTGNGAPTELYRLGVLPPGGNYQIMYDFRADNVFEWTPIEEGTYRIFGLTLDNDTGLKERVVAQYEITSRIPPGSTESVISPTSHPLVALYSAPSCAGQGAFIRVLFSNGAGPLTSNSTSIKPCVAGRSSNFYVAGMRQMTLYWMRYEILDATGNQVAMGPLRAFWAQAIPVPMPTVTVTQMADINTSLAEKVVLHYGNFPVAVDLEGEVIWYSDSRLTPVIRPVRGGSFMQIVPDANGLEGQFLREFDLVGNTLRETNMARVSDLVGVQFNDFHHEARPLPNGHTAVLVTEEKIFQDTQGTGEVDILADWILVLDENFQPVWSWSGFDHLDINRAAILGETCSGLDQPGCPPVFLMPTANDWMHSNAITYDPRDGNLLLSMRHQDWVIKIDYQDGLGTGNVIWRLGPDGDFTTDSLDPFPFQSHQHDPNFSSTFGLAIYDNGNTRCDGDPACVSRGQVYQLDEVAMTATLEANVDLPEYAFAVGSAQPLVNGNFFFNSGIQGGGIPFSGIREYLPDGTLSHAIDFDNLSYRSHRLRNLYSNPYHDLIQ